MKSLNIYIVLNYLAFPYDTFIHIAIAAEKLSVRSYPHLKTVNYLCAYILKNKFL